MTTLGAFIEANGTLIALALTATFVVSMILLRRARRRRREGRPRRAAPPGWRRPHDPGSAAEADGEGPD